MDSRGYVGFAGPPADSRSRHQGSTSPARTSRAILLTLLIVLAPGRSVGQTFEMWTDYFCNWVSGPDWSFEVNPGFAAGLTQPRWLESYIGGNTTYQPFNWLTTEGNLEAHYTFTPTDEDFIEVRPWLGANFIWAKFGGPLHVFYPMISFRLEERLFWYVTSQTLEAKERLRIRLVARFPINDVTLTQGTYYLLFLVEGYTPLDGEARELSADRKRLQAGVGYVVKPEMRVELQYIMMRTRNSQSNAFESSSHVLWLALRSFF